MPRRKKRSYKGGGGRSGGAGAWGGTIAIVFGTIAMLACLIMFGIGIQQLDSAITSAATYTEQTSLTDIMGIFGLVIFLAFMLLGLAGLVGGTYYNVKSLSSDWSQLVLLAIMGGITLVITLIMFGINNTQLHTAYVTANATTNKAKMVGLVDIMGIWGMVLFVIMLGSALTQIGFAVWGGGRMLFGRK